MQQDEPVDHFVNSLKKKIKACEYPAEMTDEILRDKIIFGVNDPAVKERLLRENDLTLKKTLDICRASEQSKEHIKQMKISESQFCEVDSIKEQKKPYVSQALKRT